MTDVFDPGALETNKAGRLADDQAKWLRNMSSGSRRGNLTAAAFCAALGLLLLLAPGSSQAGVLKPLAGFAFLLIAAFLFVRGFTGADPLTGDLRDRNVESVEGAIAKHTMSSSGRSSTTWHYIDVEGKRLQAFRDQYDAAPDAGWVRVYYLPHSHRVVNFERLPDKPLPPGALASPQQAMKAALGGMIGHGEVGRAEAMAQMQAIGDAMRAKVEGDATPPPAADRDPRPLTQAIVGSWSNGLITVEFQPDGNASTTLPGGRRQDGRWSVDANGKLVADVMGHTQAVDAWVTADGLTISEGGQAMTFTRA